ncbi:MAG: ribonuclease H-like YkuK family protein [Patescibacteria group bacterium]
MDREDYAWNDKLESITHGSVKIYEAIKIIKMFLDEDPSADYSLVIGTDSHEKNTAKNKTKVISLVTAILVHRRGFGGKYFWKRKEVENIHTLREKIYVETMSSINFASKFVPLLKKTLNGRTPKYNLEIHIDVGEHGDTRDMIKEVVGMVTGNGYVAKTKPEAYGATYIADKHT